MRALAAPFTLGKGGDAALLLHGLTGSPHEMRPLGEALAERGWRVHCPLLPGHGTDPGDLAGLTANDFYAAAREALGRVADAGRLLVGGLSMGALLATLLARDEAHLVSGLALLAPAFRLRRPEARVAGWLLSRTPLGALGKVVLRKRRTSVPVHAPLEDPSYDGIALSAVGALADLQEQAWEALPRVKAPALVVTAGRDQTADSAAARAAAGRLATPARLEDLPESGHVVLLDREAPRALELCMEHFTKLGRGP